MLVEREDREGVATLTLNRPDKLNAINIPLMVELRAQLDKHKPALIILVRICDQGVQDRVTVYRAQLEADPSTVGPFIYTAGVPYSKGVCFSCGVGLPDACFGRCWRCSLGWRLAYRLPVPAELAAGA